MIKQSSSQAHTAAYHIDRQAQAHGIGSLLVPEGDAILKDQK